MSKTLFRTFDVSGDDFSLAGEASSAARRLLRQVGVSPEIIRRVSIAMYEGEINTVIHARGGRITLELTKDRIDISIKDWGPGIEDIELAMKEGYSTASEEARELGFGAGMGLANIKKNADSLKITSEPGKGTHLEISIKIVP